MFLRLSPLTVMVGPYFFKICLSIFLAIVVFPDPDKPVIQKRIPLFFFSSSILDNFQFAYFLHIQTNIFKHSFCLHLVYATSVYVFLNKKPGVKKMTQIYILVQKWLTFYNFAQFHDPDVKLEKYIVLAVHNSNSVTVTKLLRRCATRRTWCSH